MKTIPQKPLMIKIHWYSFLFLSWATSEWLHFSFALLVRSDGGRHCDRHCQKHCQERLMMGIMTKESYTIPIEVKCWMTRLHLYGKWDGSAYLQSVIVFKCGLLTNSSYSVYAFFVLRMNIVLLWYLLLVFWSVFFGKLKLSRINNYTGHYFPSLKPAK